MKLLIVTQKVDKNDDVLGFFHAWIREFAKHCEKITVICLGKGEYDLPKNVQVLSLGKEKGASRLGYVFRFYYYIVRERKNYDTVFVHMNPEYVVLGGIPWRIMGKKISLWYTHKSVDLKLRIAEKFAQTIFTASKESFRLESKKLHVMGHGIDTEYFAPKKEEREEGDGKTKTFRVLTVGRISPSKGYETLIAAAKILQSRGFLFEIKIIGDAANISDRKYVEEMKELVGVDGVAERVRFLGAMEHYGILPYLQDADVFVNLSQTGSLDKAVLEAFASGVPVISSNEAFAPDLEPYKMRFQDGNASELAEKIIQFSENPRRKEIARALREKVEKNHNLERLIVSVIQWLS